MGTPIGRWRENAGKNRNTNRRRRPFVRSVDGAASGRGGGSLELRSRDRRAPWLSRYLSHEVRA
jgi:hypothetical protein